LVLVSVVVVCCSLLHNDHFTDALGCSGLPLKRLTIHYAEPADLISLLSRLTTLESLTFTTDGACPGFHAAMAEPLARLTALRELAITTGYAPGSDTVWWVPESVPVRLIFMSCSGGCRLL
jgi:hypothetical protein